MPFTLINPESLGAPSGFSHGVLADARGQLLVISRHGGWHEKQQIVSGDFVEQFDGALANLITVVKAADGKAADIVRLIIYVTNKGEYRARTNEVGERYRR